VSDAAPLLALEATSKRYGSVQALADASLVVRQGTVHALLGENGAGKTTLMRIAFGLAQADSGTIRWLGVPARFPSPRDALAAGIAMVQQHFSLVPSLTVAENVALGGRGLYDAAKARRRVRELAETTGLAVDPDAVASALGVSAQQRVEILKALARGVKLLILDEPTATLAPGDAAALLAWLRRFASGDRSVVLITHKLRDALAVADDVTVLRAGRVVLSSAAASASEQMLASAMLGNNGGRDRRELLVTPETAPGNSADARGPIGEAVVALSNVVTRPGVETPGLLGITLAIGRGEIVGVAAVEGNGERELLRIMAGRARAERGTVTLPARIGHIPQDRHADAIADDLSLTENIALAGAGARRGWIDWAAMRRRTEQLMARFDVRADRAAAPARTLSGGNQQRLVLARELAGDPMLVVADQPTRGLDLRATAAVHDRLRQARLRGAAVVLHSTDLDEILALADRVVVVAGGRLREVSGGREAIGRAMLGVDG
jgi:simple sugar transport system ATP-binding protein